MPGPRLALIDRIRASRIVVVGDLILIATSSATPSGLSPEAPVPVVTVREHRAALGGAANVAANVAAIGATCRTVGGLATIWRARFPHRDGDPAAARSIRPHRRGPAHDLEDAGGRPRAAGRPHR
jgi:hypothetical protein